MVVMSGKEKSGGHSSGQHLCQRFSVQVQHWETEIFPVWRWNRVFPRCRDSDRPAAGQSWSSTKVLVFLWLVTAMAN